MAECLGGLVKWLDGLAAGFCQVAEDCDGAAGDSSREDDRPLYAVARLRGCEIFSKNFMQFPARVEFSRFEMSSAYYLLKVVSPFVRKS
ncbi:MAG TPA: hypothetical protein VIK35_03475 [Verrucomicrobiae bacterium]